MNLNATLNTMDSATQAEYGAWADKLIRTCTCCHNMVAERGSRFCWLCNRLKFPQDYTPEELHEAQEALNDVPTYRRVDVDYYVEIVDREERGALRSDGKRDDR